jgi:hemerythrin-like metal-binding protein
MTINPAAYNLGIKEMDAQHAQLIRIIEDFIAVSAEDYFKKAGTDAATRTLEQLLKYAGAHFISEELFIAAHNYPGLEAHKKKHREIEAGVAKLLDEIRALRSRNTPIKLKLFVTVWLLEHLVHEDGKYARFVLDKSACPPTPTHQALPDTGRPLLRQGPAGPVF